MGVPSTFEDLRSALRGLHFGDSFAARDMPASAILPSSLLVAACPLLVLYYSKKADVVRSSRLLYSKLIVAGSLVMLELVAYLYWDTLNPQDLDANVSTNSLSLAAALCLSVGIYFEHKRTLRSTAWLAIWLIVSICCDGYRLQTLASHLHGQIYYITGNIALRMALLILAEAPKQSHILDERIRQNIGREATSGFLSRSLLLWLNNTLLLGFRNILSIEQLDNLEPEFSSDLLSEQFAASWEMVDKNMPNCLATAGIQTLFLPLLTVILPRLCFAVFILLQAIFVYDTIAFTESAFATQDWQSGRSGLLAFAAITYLGIGVSKAAYTRLNDRLVVRTRGILASQIYQKSLRIHQNVAEAKAAITHISTDIEGLASGIPKLHEMWALPLQVMIAIYLLTLLVGRVTVFLTLPLAIHIYVSWYLGEHAPAAGRQLSQSIQARVSETSAMLSQLKAAKMVGLEKIISRTVETLRAKEIEDSIAARTWTTVRLIAAVFCHALPGPVLIAGGLFWTGFSSKLNVQDTYTTLAVLELFGDPITRFTDIYPSYCSTLEHAKRIQEYLLLAEPVDQRHDVDADINQRQLEANLLPEQVNFRNKPRPDNCVVEMRDASFALPGTEDIVLRSVTIDVRRGEVVALVGPTACGKSTLLCAIIGEGTLITGSIYVQPGPIAYCDQTAWIYNCSIRDIIVGKANFNALWYESVLDACCLRNDLRRFANGDETLAGSRGLNLSEGQKQRLAVARAVYAQREIIVMDDVFSALDRDTAQTITSRLLGANGLLRQSGTTVIMTTQSIQLLEAADKLLIIDTDKRSRVYRYSHSPIFRDHLQAVLQRINTPQRRAARPRGNIVQNQAENDIPYYAAADEAGDDSRQYGDVDLYLFYFKSFQTAGVIAWLLYTLFASWTEVFPNAYVRIWLDAGPQNKWFFAGYVVIALLSSVFTALSLRTWFLKLVPSSADRLHRMVLDTIMNSTLHFLSATDHGVLLNIFSEDMTAALLSLPQNLVVLVYITSNFLFRTAITFTATDYSAIIVPILFSALYFAQHYYLRTSRQIAHLDVEYRAPLVTHFTETAAGLRHIRSFGWQKQCVDRLHEVLDASQKVYYHTFSIRRWLTLVVDMNICISNLAIVILAIVFKSPSSGIGLALTSLIPLASDSHVLLERWTAVETSLGTLSRLKTLIEETPVEKDPADGNIKLPEKDKENGRVLFQDVTARYDTNDASPALNKASFVIPAGWKVGIIGRTGSGKSSVLMTLLNFLHYTGKITIDGVDISKIPRDILRSKYITTVSQDSINFDESVKYNLCPWTMSVSQEEEGNPNNLAMEFLLAELGLWEVIGGEPGLYKKVSELGLSHGQKQLLSIARGCMQHLTFDGNIVLMDEVTSNLDADTQDNVIRVLKEVFEDATVFMVAHRAEALQGVDLMMNVEDGRVFMTAKEDSDRQQRERRERARMQAPQMRYGWQPGNYPPDLARHMMMAAERDVAYFDAQRRGEGPSQI